MSWMRLAAELSTAQAVVLKRHVDGPAPVELGRNMRQTLDILKRRRLVSFCNENGAAVVGSARRPRFARLTELGRAVLAARLAIEAEHLVLAHEVGAVILSPSSLTEKRTNHAVAEPDQSRQLHRIPAVTG